MFGSIIKAVAPSLISTVAGGILNDRSAKNANEQSADVSREFAQSGIQWRVQDARKAGIHPLAAMGIPLSSGPSATIGGTDWSSALGNMGQDISRAAGAVQTPKERQKAAVLDGLKLERASLENELLRSQIASTNRASNPPLPSTSTLSGDPTAQTGLTAGTRTVPVEVSSAEKNPAKAAGYHPDLTYVHTSSGGLAIVPSKDAKQLIEDQIVPEALWSLRNHIGTFIKDPPYPSVPPPSGYSRWKWHPFLQEWRPAKSKPSGQGPRYRESLKGPIRY